MKTKILLIVILFATICCEKQSKEDIFDYNQYLGYWKEISQNRTIDIQCINPLLANYKRGEKTWICSNSEIIDEKLHFIFIYDYFTSIVTHEFEITLLNKEEISIKGISTSLNDDTFTFDWIFKKSIKP